jgi:hypothetical protein
MFLPLAAVLLLAALWTIYWFVAGGLVKARFAEERTRLAAQGLTLACAEESWGGFPFHFEFTCSTPVASLDGGGEIRSSRLLLAALAYAPWQVVALLDGPSTFSAPGAPPIQAEHQRAIAAVTFEGDGKARMSADIPALSIPGIGTAAKVMLHSRPAAAGGTDVAVSVTEGNYQPAGKPPLQISQGDFMGSLAPGAVLKVENVTLQNGNVRYWGTGTVGLDAGRRISGRLETETNDLDGLLKILEPHLQMSDQQATGLRSILGLLGNEAKAPLIAQDGVLYIGPFKLADLPPLH